LLLGLGNDLLTDDAIGLNVAREIRRRLADSQPSTLNSQLLDIQETSEMGLSLLDMISGYESLVVVDAVQTGQAPPGTIHELDLESLPVLSPTAPHFVGLGEVIALGRTLGMPMPSQVRIFAIEAAEVFTLATRMTPALEQALPGIVERVLAAL
jgi:hydrogenase maturation protease